MASRFLQMGLACFVLIIALVHGKTTTFLQQKPEAPAPFPTVFMPDAVFPPNSYDVTSYGADPTGQRDSSDAIMRAVADALNGPSNGFLMNGIANLGGAQVNLQGGNYLISRPLQFAAGRGNILIHGGTLKASGTFPGNRYLIELSETNNKGPYSYEFVTFRDLLLDSTFRGGGILVANSLRTSIDNCYITHFTTNGISVQGGHETFIRNCYLGQHITAGGDPGEKSFTGTAIHLDGNDNSVTDVVIFSAGIGIMISGQANTISGVHCYNKATGFGGTGVYLKTPGLTQTRIVHSYFDYTGIVAEDPVQLDIANCFFLGDAFIVLKSVRGQISGVNIVDNQFAGSNKGTDIVQLDQGGGRFSRVDQVVVDQNSVNGMHLRATVARGRVDGNGTSWRLDFNRILLFPDLVKSVQYTLSTSDHSFPRHALRNASNNNVVVESDVPVRATIFVVVDQGNAFSPN